MIYLLTACSRPENLAKMKEHIPPECHWAIMFDAAVPNPTTEFGNTVFPQVEGVSGRDGSCGSRMYNHMLAHLPLQPDDWIQLADDDNVIHSDWYRVVAPYCVPENNVLAWGQLLPDGKTPRLKPPAHMRVGFVDTAMFMWRHGHRPHIRLEHEYTYDGFLAEDLGKPSKVIQQYLCYYNFLRPEAAGTTKITPGHERYYMRFRPVRKRLQK